MGLGNLTEAYKQLNFSKCNKKVVDSIFHADVGEGDIPGSDDLPNCLSRDPLTFPVCPAMLRLLLCVFQSITEPPWLITSLSSEIDRVVWETGSGYAH